MMIFDQNCKRKSTLNEVLPTKDFAYKVLEASTKPAGILSPNTRGTWGLSLEKYGVFPF